jgi:hypothetical protein
MPKPDVDVQVFLLLVRHGKIIEVTAGTSKYAKTLVVKELGKATAKFFGN